ncbi:hypothetical protein ANN_26803 [Periplaneta americana]|uniref:Uncharacterized protein n=1 Tax=Periplaneta americana TaxID=6978 RepID=A0ABQ8RZ37_PERAM|nr:hypothetical protein ANN_26803 [Periplaneta americana]
MAGLCEGGNEPPCSLKASNICSYWVEKTQKNLNQESNPPPGFAADALGTVTPQVWTHSDWNVPDDRICLMSDNGNESMERVMRLRSHFFPVPAEARIPGDLGRGLSAPREI